VTSRRLGNSLGINLLPINKKVCNFNCLYCECGLTKPNHADSGKLPGRAEIRQALEKYLTKKGNTVYSIDTITFAGNGEPTMHPDFSSIVEDTILLRNKYSPDARIAVLSNATLIHRKKVKQSLMKVDYNILKLDSAVEETIKILNCPIGYFSLEKLTESLKEFKENLTIQTLFIRGSYNGKKIDNTTENEVSTWLNLLNILRPQLVMVYSISRDTPIKELEKIDAETLNKIAERVRSMDIPVSVSA
jgi:wyosine [tRNA(Phe)-imidazoG37] synthetase (radical SAM superfamily)